MNIENTTIPSTLSEAHEELFKIFDKDAISDFKLGRLSATSLHHGFGPQLRNYWGLWGESDLAQYFKSIGVNHADDMYCIILDSFVCKLNGETFDLDNRVKHYQEYWRKMNNNERIVIKIPKI
jgi:hypothetical protein